MNDIIASCIVLHNMCTIRKNLFEREWIDKAKMKVKTTSINEIVSLVKKLVLKNVKRLTKNLIFFYKIEKMMNYC